MPSHRSAEKRVRQAEKRRRRNVSVKSALRTATKKARQAIAAGDPAAEELTREAISGYDKAAAKGVIHRRTASRKQARLLRALHKGGSSA